MLEDGAELNVLILGVIWVKIMEIIWRSGQNVQKTDFYLFASLKNYVFSPQNIK